MAQLLEDAAINAGWEPWQVEALLDHLTPAVLADMVNDPADRSAVTRQPSPPPEVAVHRMPEKGEMWFWQLWTESV